MWQDRIGNFRGVVWLGLASLGCALAMSVAQAKGKQEEPRQKLAYVVAVDRDCKSPGLQRGGKRLDLRFGDDLLEADRLFGPDCVGTPVMVLQYHSGLRKALYASDLPYEVVQQGKRPTIVSNLWERVGEIFDELDTTNTTLTLNTMRASNPVMAPWAREQTTLVSPERTRLQLFWVKGVPPFTLMVKDSQGRVIQRHAGLQVNQYEIEFPSEHASITVDLQSSAQSERAEAMPDRLSALIRRMSAAEWQQLTVAISDDAGQLPPEIFSLAILGAGGAALTLEAYQYVADSEDDPKSSTTGQLRAGFELGAFPDYVRLTE